MRSKVSPQIGVIVKLLESDDLQTVINTADCLNNLCEDGAFFFECLGSIEGSFSLTFSLFTSNKSVRSHSVGGYQVLAPELVKPRHKSPSQLHPSPFTALTRPCVFILDQSRIAL